jgi:deferrochelatase/peroxidase EfeB
MDTHIIRHSFGFEDGISQPLMGGIDKLEPKPDGKEGFVVNMNTDPKLLIVTGGSASGKSIARPTWMHNGSFLVLRKLEQHVGAFRALTAKYNDYNCKNAAHMGAKLMGRWQSGEYNIAASIPSPSGRC